MTFNDDELGSELQPIADRLRAERPTLSAMELDVVKQRVRTAAARPTTTKRGFMRSRLAILLMLVLGLTFSTTGAGLAISGFADGGGQAASTQYDDDDDGGGVLPDSDDGDNGGGGGGGADARQRRPGGRPARPPVRVHHERRVAPVHRLRRDPRAAPRPRPPERRPDRAAHEPRRRLSRHCCGILARAATLGHRPGPLRRSASSRSIASASCGLRRRASAAIGRGSSPLKACATARP